MKYDLLCVGDINVDLIASQLRRMPAADTQASVEMHPRLGGEAANTAVAAARLGLKTAFIGAIGANDPYSPWLRRRLDDAGVGHHLAKKMEKTAMTFAITFENGNRTFFTDSGANKTLKFSDLSLDLVRNSKHLFIGGYWHNQLLLKDGNTRLFKYAFQNNIQTSLGVGWNHLGWSGERRRQLFKTLDNVGTLFINRRELADLTRSTGVRTGCEKVRKHAKNIVVHMGAKGCYLSSDGFEGKICAKPVKARNPVGTGDAFNAAYIRGILHKWPSQRCGEYANAVGRQKALEKL